MNSEIKDKSRPFIKGVIDRLEGRLAVIRIDGGQQLNWPADKLPADCRAGAAIILFIGTDQDEQAEREKLAKTILNQILRDSE